MGTRLLVVQHGEKRRTPGDPGLTATGRHQAEDTARWIAGRFDVAAVWASPLRRAVETARPLAVAVGVEVAVDPRLRERMSWDGRGGQTSAEFLEEWQRATADRSYVPSSGDSSEQAASRFIAAISDIDDGMPTDDATIAVVAHGGVTVDTLRTIAGDAHLRGHMPELITDGVPCGAVTILGRHEGRWQLEQLPSTSHLDDEVR